MASESVLMTVALCEPTRQPGPPAALLGRLPRPLDALHLGGHRPRKALGEDTRPYSAQRNHVSVTLRVQLSGSSFQVPCWKSPLAIEMIRGPARSPYRTAEA